MMQKIDLNKILANSNLAKNRVAKLLFPNNRHPGLALGRILSGEAVLDADQIILLANFIGVPVGMLYDEKGWKSEELSKNKIVLSNGDFTAELDTETWTTKIFKNGSLEHEFVLQKPAIALRDFIDLLNSKI